MPYGSGPLAGPRPGGGVIELMSPVKGAQEDNKGGGNERPWSRDSVVSWRIGSASDIDPANDPKIRSHVQRLLTPPDLATKKAHTIKSTDWPWANNSLGGEVRDDYR